MTEGVLIPGWKIPDNCLTCPFFHAVVANGGHGSYIECKINHRELPKNRLRELMLVRDDNCELRKYMTPNGRLIDADLLGKILKERAEDEWNKNTAPFSWSYAYECLIDTLDNMPTVIEEEE